MSALPKAVQRQVEEANRLAEHLAQEQRAAATPPAGDAPAGEAPAPAQPPAPPSGDAQPPAAPPAPEGWEQKYKVLQGKYNAEVPRLQQTVREQNSAIEQMRQQLTATQSMLSALAQNRIPASGHDGGANQPPVKLVKDDEVKEFGEDLTDFIRRVAQEALLPVVEKKLQPVQSQVEQTRAQSEEDRQRAAQIARAQFLSELDRALPTWRQTNVDPEFIEWLGQMDPYAGVPRQQLLVQAYNALDVPRVVTFFEGFRKEHAVVTPPPPAAPAPPAAPQTKLDTYIAPGAARAGSTVTPDGAGKRIWTEAEIKRFYDDCTAGKFRSNVDRRKEIEQEIILAAREGRVR